KPSAVAISSTMPEHNVAVTNHTSTRPIAVSNSGEPVIPPIVPSLAATSRSLEEPVALTGGERLHQVERAPEEGLHGLIVELLGARLHDGGEVGQELAGRGLLLGPELA